MHNYTPNPANNPVTIPLIDDSDTPDASNFNPTGQALADKVDFALANRSRLKRVLFSASGTWVVPPNVTEALVIGCGGGGGGAGGQGGGNTAGEVSPGGGGGAGAKPTVIPIGALTPGQMLTITIGAGGVGGTGGAGGTVPTTGAAGAQGGDSTVALPGPTVIAILPGGGGAPANAAFTFVVGGAAYDVALAFGGTSSVSGSHLDDLLLDSIGSLANVAQETGIPAYPRNFGDGGTGYVNASTQKRAGQGMRSAWGWSGAQGGLAGTNGSTNHGGGGGGGGGGGVDFDNSGAVGGVGGNGNDSGAGGNGTNGANSTAPCGGGGGGGGSGGIGSSIGGNGGNGGNGVAGLLWIIYADGPDEA